MKISIALCTYNGSRYLSGQLESFAKQTRPPDELILVDDRSNDETVDIARQFAAKAPFPVNIYENSTNLGSTANFEKAIGLCTGDIVALSDQDDVWLPQKLERFEKLFESDRRIGMVFSNAMLTSDDLKPLGVRLWRETFRPRDRRTFARGNASEVLMQYNVVTGATMAIRRQLVDAVLPIPKLPEFIHDAWIALIASLSSKIVSLDEDLVLYRQHSAQQLGAGLSRWDIPRAERYRLTIEDRRVAIRRLDDLRAIITDTFLERLRVLAPDSQRVPSAAEFETMLFKTREKIEEHIRHITARLELPFARPLRLPEIIGEFSTGRYGVYSRGWQSAVLDLVRK